MDEPRRLAGRYELRKVLGRGGMAEVYLGHDARLGRTVALKTLLPDLARDPTFQARFRREAQSAASLNHPAIVAVYDTDEDFVDGISTPFIVMEYVEGATLRDVLRSGQRQQPGWALEMCAGVLDALAYSHQNGIVHRDIKPANIMLTESGQVKVMDFGIARAMGDAGMTMTQTSAVVGTAHYLSPEQARGEKVDARSDLYSTGCLLYELLTGRPPFTGDSPVAVAYQHVSEEPWPPSVLDREVTPATDAIVLRALVKNRDHRYQSAEEMRAGIDAALEGRPFPVADPPTTELRQPQGPATASLPPADGGDHPPRAARQRRPSKAPRVLLALLAILLLVGAGAFGRSLLDREDTGAAPETEPVPVPVPDLRGMTLNAAREAAARGDFEVRRDESRPCQEEEGTVCTTNPGPGAEIDPGDTVRLIMSSGAEPVEVPDVTGDAFEDALEELQEAGLDVAQEPEENAEEEPGTVLWQDPEGGSEAEPGETVTLTVAEAPAEEEEPVEPEEPEEPEVLGCTSEQLELTAGDSSEYAGATTIPLLLTNIGDSSCSMTGFPGVSMVTDEGGEQIGVSAERIDDGGEATPAELAPGDTAQADLTVMRVENYPPDECGVTAAGGLLLYPPDEFDSLYLPYEGLSGCLYEEESLLSVTALYPAATAE
jgi:eukaryotic-like serine/threonine-protein kinase